MTTLGEVLYARSAPRVTEAEWTRLVERSARRDADAVHELYDRTHRAVYTLLLRLTCDREAAEALTVDVYSAVLRDAALYRAESGTVLAWIMNLARSSALARLRSDQERHRAGRPDRGLLVLDMPDYRNILRYRDETRMLAGALGALSSAEREALEAAYFGEQAPEEAGFRSRVRAGLRKLARALGRATDFIGESDCSHAELAAACAVHSLAPPDRAAVESHLEACRPCRRDLDAFRPVVGGFAFWPTDLLRPEPSLRGQLTERIAGRSARAPERTWREPEWENVAPGIFCKLLSHDERSGMVGMLVRLVPGGEYPPHSHSAVEELHLLHGELWIDDRKLHAGEYNRAEPATSDKRVWSETGCCCVLVTSSKDVLA